MNERTPDLDSTLIRRGNQATTFREMTEFAETIENRPLDKLLDELPSLARLSDMKFSVARAVIRRRSRTLEPLEREQLRRDADAVAARTESHIAARIRAVFL